MVILFCILILALLSVVGFVVERKETLERHKSTIQQWKTRYPLAFPQKYGSDFNIDKLDRNQVLQIVHNDEDELLHLENEIVAELERQRRQYEEKLRKEEELRIAEEERKKKELQEKYDELLVRFPHGCETYNKRHFGRFTVQEIVADRLRVESYENMYLEYDFYNTWHSAHSTYSKNCRNLRNVELSGWGYYKYPVDVRGKDEDGSDKKYQFIIWQHFCESFCRDMSLDYTHFNGQKIAFNNLNGIIAQTRHFYNSVYDNLVSFLEKLPENKLVVFFDSKLGTDWKQVFQYHFSYLETKLIKCGIPYAHANDSELLSQTKRQYLIAIELITSNEQLIENCEYLFRICKECKPCITYFTLLKEFSSSEMQSLIDDDNKKRKEQEEKERLEQQKAAEEKRQREMEEERRKKEAQRVQLVKKRLSSKVENWDTVYGSTLHYSYLLNYYPTTCEFEATQEEWNDRRVVWNFKNTPGKTTYFEHKTALNYIIPILSERLRSTFGDDLNEITLVCIPASSSQKTQLRYEEFSDRLCKATGMTNSYPYITVQGKRGAKHEGEETIGDISYSIDKEFFNGRNILLFDDVITKGASMRTWKSKMETLGATVFAAMTIGKTTHERPNDQHNTDFNDLPF